MSFRHDSKYLASCGYDNRLVVWDAEKGDVSWSGAAHKGYASQIAWSVDGNLLVSTGYDKTVRVWDARKPTALQVGTLNPKP